MGTSSSFYQDANPTPVYIESALSQLDAILAAALSATQQSVNDFLNSLPTTLPATDNTWWLNGGVLSRT